MTDDEVRDDPEVGPKASSSWLEELEEEARKEWELITQEARKNSRETRMTRLEYMKDVVYFAIIVGTIAFVLLAFLAVIWVKSSCSCGGGL